MDTPSLERNIKDLENEVNQYSTTKKTFLPKLSLNNKYIIYGSLPVILLILLLIIRPSFLYYENEQKQRKLSFKKLFLTTIIVSIIIVVSIFAYRYKKIN